MNWPRWGTGCASSTVRGTERKCTATLAAVDRTDSPDHRHLPTRTTARFLLHGYPLRKHHRVAPLTLLLLE